MQARTVDFAEVTSAFCFAALQGWEIRGLALFALRIEVIKILSTAFL
jgi:hypothetical protein